jgi:hypothetical protein
MSEKCEECGAYYKSTPKSTHAVNCSRNTPEQLRTLLDLYYNDWIRMQSSASDVRKRMVAIAMRWEGKCKILKHENNKLRNKLYRKENKE